MKFDAQLAPEANGIATDFHEAWREARGAPAPSAEHIVRQHQALLAGDIQDP